MNQYSSSRLNRLKAIEIGEKTYEGYPCKRCQAKIKCVERSSCVKCRNERGIARLNNSELMTKYRTKEKQNDKQQKWRASNPDKVAEQNKRRKSESDKWREQNRDELFFKNIKRLYGIKKEEYNSMMTEQNRQCLICKMNFDDLKKSPAIDHCHKTNKIRGLLCSNCNTGLGLFKDNPDIMKKAIRYLCD